MAPSTNVTHQLNLEKEKLTRQLVNIQTQNSDAKNYGIQSKNAISNGIGIDVSKTCHNLVQQRNELRNLLGSRFV